MGSLIQERFRDDDGGRAAVRGGTALEFCERRVDHGGGENLVEGVGVAELGVGVFRGVEVVDAGDFGEVGGGGAVSGGGRGWLVGWDCFSESLRGKKGGKGSSLFHVLSPCISKHLCRAWCIGDASRSSHHRAGGAGRADSVVEEALQTAWKHLLETHYHDTVRHTVADHVPRHM